ncbi:MAG: dihydrolipoamide acetyltransferase family protein [Dehalococcoidales bacterium]|nr:dihydrolipoamide acetyltransferase family protein [Dehalococcoidales bacterium]
MAVEILMPQLGMDMTEGTVGRWLVAGEASVQEGEDLLEIETDKVTHTVQSPAAGRLERLAEEGQVVAVGGRLGLLRPAEQGSVGASEVGGEAGPGAVESTARASGEVRATPLARRLAARHGIDLADITGSGPEGRIVEADVQAAIEKGRQAARPNKAAILQRVPLSGRRRVIAQRMVASLAKTAQLTITREVEATALVAARRELLERADASGARASYDAFVIKALALALAEQPNLNATVEGEEIVLFADVHVAVAIASGDGLVTPVVRAAQKASLVEIARVVEGYAAKTREGRLTPDDLLGGTVTVTNLGVFGVDTFTPILNPPQSAILGVGRILSRPIVVAGDLLVRPTVHLSLTWDHRIADGAEAAFLLGRVAELLTEGTNLLLAADADRVAYGQG